MSGVAVIRALLVVHAPTLAIAPKARIAAGVLPKGTALPALAIEPVIPVDRKVVSPGAMRHVVERVRVTGLAKSYPELHALMKAQKQACADQFPDHAGLTAVTVHTDGGGPYFVDEEASIHMMTQDYRVTYSEVR